ncbi:DUF2536 family protein [Bacillus suaedaesalsae]|uniref:DUF2536 family protein n=1 Tax=Bacillus suaedaesalsae TaxID=2810349 RepID=A0ABS2DPN1_9BACI|nr:DUF2536 family protein [Bacillus suaedaesalsae]MBM6619676.1 DUF2536 family protein [Bacillus suaedaesalsae]
MQFMLDQIDDKVEFFEAHDLVTLEKKIQEKIDLNKAILLEVHHVSHTMAADSKTNKPYFTAMVHFKRKKL